MRDVYKDPLHPYTVGLLKSVPKLHQQTDSLYNIRGMVPSPKDYPAGCRFCPRCEDVCEKCEKEQPPLFQLPDGRKVRCWKYAPKGGSEE